MPEAADFLVKEISKETEGHSRDTVGQSPALGDAPMSIDPDWREKIEFAKLVREETRKARGDRPSTFDMQGRPIRIRR